MHYMEYQKLNKKPCYFSYILIVLLIKTIKSRKKIIPYYPVGVITNTLYGKFIEQLFILNKINYVKLEKPYFCDLQYFTASRRKLISVNPDQWDFVDHLVSFTPLSQEELMSIEEHTGLRDLGEAQHHVMKLLSDINAYQIVKENYIENEEYEKMCGRITSVNRVANGFIIQVGEEQIKVGTLLTDHIDPLETNEVLHRYYHNENEIIAEDKYIVNHLNYLESLKKKKHHRVIPLPFYGITPTRPNLVLHPFHFPKTKDPILTLMIITQNILQLL